MGPLKWVGPGGGSVSRGNGGRKGSNDQSGRDIFTGEAKDRVRIEDADEAWRAGQRNKKATQRGRKPREYGLVRMWQGGELHTGCLAIRGKSGGGGWENAGT